MPDHDVTLTAGGETIKTTSRGIAAAARALADGRRRQQQIPGIERKGIAALDEQVRLYLNRKAEAESVKSLLDDSLEQIGRLLREHGLTAYHYADGAERATVTREDVERIKVMRPKDA